MYVIGAPWSRPFLAGRSGGRCHCGRIGLAVFQIRQFAHGQRALNAIEAQNGRVYGIAGRHRSAILTIERRDVHWFTRAIIAPNENPNPEFKVNDAKRGGHQMRLDNQPIKEDSEAVGFNFHFQIASDAGRKACSVCVQARNFHDATVFFRQNWPTIELMARDSLAVAAEGAEIKLAMPLTRTTLQEAAVIANWPSHNINLQFCAFLAPPV
jgi:hypothetical protein